MKNFRDIYKFPLYVEHYIGWVHDADDQFVFQFEDGLKREDRSGIVEVINGTRVMPETKFQFVHINGQIIEAGSDTVIITIRGWGNLTGIGAHNLSGEEAANIQDTFADYIVEQLNNQSSDLKDAGIVSGVDFIFSQAPVTGSNNKSTKVAIAMENDFAMIDSGSMSSHVLDLVKKRQLMEIQAREHLSDNVITLNDIDYTRTFFHDDRVTSDLINEFELIQQKKSKLSRSKRERVCAVFYQSFKKK